MLDELEQVNWRVLLRTYGSFHQTLIGLIASWWNMLSDANWAIDVPPACAMPQGRKHADLILGTRREAVVVVEAEGTHYAERLKAIADHLDSDDPCFQPLSHGLVLAYPTSARGRGAARDIKPVPTDQLIEQCKIITRERPRKSLVLIDVKKRYEAVGEGIRARSEYYSGTVSAVRAYEFSGGVAVAQREFVLEA